MRQTLVGHASKFNGMKMLLYAIYASLDLHVGHTVLGWMDPEGRMLGRRRFVTSAENLQREVAALGKAGVVLILEAGPMMRWAAAILRPLVDRLVVCDPRHNRLVCADPHKSDWKDVEALCRLLRMGEIKEVWVGEDPRRDLLRATVMEYLKWRNQQRTLKTLIKSRYHQLGIHRLVGKAVFGREGREQFLGQIPDPEHRILLERLYRQFDGAWSMWLETGRQVRRLGRAFPEIAQFQRIPGIAAVGAHVFDGIVEDPDRFERISRLWRFCRLGITSRTSDNKPLGYERIDRAGHGELKNVSYTAWRTACKKTTGENEVRRFYQNSLSRTGSVRHARLNTQRKIIEVMWTIWRKGLAYDPEMFFPTATPTTTPKGVAG